MSFKKNIDVLIYSPTFEELKEVQKILPDAHLDRIAKEEGVPEFLYDKGTLSIKGKKHSIRLISPQKAGQRSAQTLMDHTLRIWDPRIVVLTGVAGSLRDAQIGDILLPRKIWIHDLFKTTPNGDNIQPDSVDSSGLLVSLAERFFVRNNWEEKIKRDYFNHLPSELKPEKNRCFGDGNIVSSVELVEKHLKCSDAIKKYMDFDRKLYGIEQEAGAIGEVLKGLRIPWINIRVVMDLADSESRKEYKDKNKRQASKLAANFTINFLKYYFSQKLIKENKKAKNSNAKRDIQLKDTSTTEISIIMSKIRILIDESELRDNRLKIRSKMDELLLAVKSLNLKNKKIEALRRAYILFNVALEVYPPLKKTLQSLFDTINIIIL